MDRDLRLESIYSVYLRNHNQEGTFLSLIDDLDRIEALGCKWIWLLPIHPIGNKDRKGSMGCPYSIADYRNVNPEYGSLKDFQELTEAIHQRNMKLMIDVVYNHTSRDSLLLEKNPAWFHHDGSGNPAPRFEEWSDVADLEYQNADLREYLIETLQLWQDRGVDGFRCDVAPMVPMDFWEEARRRCAEKNPETLWLAETVHPSFVRFLRNQGFTAHSDGECYRAFDLTYDYDGYSYLQDYMAGKTGLESYLHFRRLQESLYPAGYGKLRFLENHDNPRLAALFPQPDSMMNWLSFMMFDKGTALIYGGMERCDKNTPSLFEKDPVNWEGPDISPLIRRLNQMRINPLRLSDDYDLPDTGVKGTIAARYKMKDKELWGIFNMEQKQTEISLEIPDGSYMNQLTGEAVEIQEGKLKLMSQPVIIEIS